MKRDTQQQFHHYERLNEHLDHLDSRAMDRLKQNLRDSYIQMKDVSNRCLVDLSNTEKNDKRIFYFKPESVLLNDPEQQRIYREQTIKLLSSTPKPPDPPSLTHTLNQELLEGIQDLSEPEDARQLLAEFYRRRMYNLEQKKYKVLLRWAHFALTSEYLDRIGHHGTFTYGRLQYELENSIKRYERLTQDDDYEQVKEGQRQRPKTKGKDEEVSQSMYAENPRKDPLSCIRMDDFEIYLRSHTYELKLFRTLEKFCARLKWLPLSKSLDIAKEAHLLLAKDQELRFKEQKEYEKKVRMRFDQSNLRKTDDIIVQMEEILGLHYPQHPNEAGGARSKPPVSITNIMDLQVRIIDRASQFKIYGDIELDEGHSFAYQVQIFFTTYFQRQIVKSQFSYYDQTVRDMKDAYESNESHGNEDDGGEGDINEIQRRNLKSLLLIDFQMIDSFNSNHDQNNLFLLKKGKKIIEQIPELKKNFEDITLVRLKKAYWLEYVMLRPKVDDQQRQQNAFLSYDYTPDLLLQSAQDFLDLNDIATINTVYQDIASIYNNMGKSHEDLMKELDKIIGHSLVTDQQAKRVLLHFKTALKSNTEDNEHLERPINHGKTMIMSKNSPLRVLPRHYLHSLHTLRHMRLRDTKTKLLYVLNFFRAIQKRLTLDLREFAGRELVSESVEVKAPQEATYIGKNSQTISGNISYSMRPGQEDEKFQGTFKDNKPKQSTATDSESGSAAEGDKVELVDLKKWKYNGNFHVQMLGTCPIIPTFHTKHGEPLEDKGMQPDFTDSKSTNKTHITKKSSQLLTRMDTFKVDEATQEIFVIDDYGMHLMYDCSLDDLLNLDKELLKSGTFYIRKTESSFDFKHFKFPLVDRFQVLEDLVECEFNFQYAKAMLVLTYLDVYEHVCDPLEQQRLCQLMTDLMSLRPRLDTSSSDYFQESYRAEVRVLETQQKLMREIVEYQMKSEKAENKHIKEYLQMTYKIANEYVNKQWSDTNQEDLQKSVKTRQVIQGGMRYQDLQEMQEQANLEKENEPTHTQDTAGGAPRESNVDQFAEILGLKNMSVEKMMKQHQANNKSDETTEEVMSQDANFIKTQEGYPIFLKESTDSLSKVKFSNFSQEIGVLDFYESLSGVAKGWSAVEQMFGEVIENAKPANQLQLVTMHLIYLEKCYVEFKKCVAYQQDELIEYKGSQYIENDLIMSSPDKMMFLIKDMVAHLTRTYKKSLNPFFVSKLDFYTVHNFTFPDILKDSMVTLQRLDVNFTRNFIETQLTSRGAQARFFPKLREDDRKVNTPPMLLIFCNLMEVLRLREHLITSLSETAILQEIYSGVRDLVGRNNYKIMFQNPLNFETFTTAQEQLNFVEDGSLTEVDIDLAVNEYDPNLRSNLNFMNSESFQCLVLDNGLAELRAATHYQFMHKHILTIAVKTNQKLIHNYRRALLELDLLQNHKIKLDNPIVDYGVMFRAGNNYLNEEIVQQNRSRYMGLLSQESGELIVQVIGIKQQLRTTVERKFKQMLSQLSNLKEHYHDIESQILYMPPYSLARLMRDYKISLLHCYCQSISKLNLLEAQRLQSIEYSLELKQLMNLLPKEIGLFKIQENDNKEGFYQNAYFDAKTDGTEDNNYFQNFEQGEISSFMTIPSVKTILLMGPYTKEEKSLYEKSLFELDSLDYDLDNFKKNRIEDINLRSKQRRVVRTLLSKAKSFPLEVTDHTVLGRCASLLKLLVEMFELHYFYSKINTHPLESLQLDLSAQFNLPFWSQQDSFFGDQLILSDIEDQDLSEKIMKKLIDEQRNKNNLSDELEQLGKVLRGAFIRMMNHIGASSLVESIEYLSKYTQQLHCKLLAGLLTLLDNFYSKGKGPGPIGNTHWGLRELTNIDLVAPSFQNGTVMYYKNLDPSQRNLSLPIKQDTKNFQYSVKALRGEKELVDPAQLLLEDMFVEQMAVSNQLNCFGSQLRRKYSFLNVNCLYNTLQTLVLGFEREDIAYVSSVYSQVEQTVKELLEMDKIVNDTSLYSLQKKSLYFQDIIRSKLLQFVLTIFISNQPLSVDSKYYSQKQYAMYKQELTWKIDYEFEKKCNKQIYSKQQKPAEGSSLRQQQHNSINEERIARAAQQVQDNVIQQSLMLEMHKAESREMNNRQMKSGHIKMKAIIKMCQRELERRMIRMAIDVINKHHNALCKCIEMCSKNIDRGIETPIHNFAPCFFEHLGKKITHLEPLNRVSQIQTLLTRIRNRGMDIETLTSGPGIVLTYKDLNECLQSFCTEMISFGEKEMKTRTTGYLQMLEHQKNLIYIKDTRVEALKRKFRLVNDNITRIVNSRIYEKGNALIFELDRSLREVRFYEEHIYVFEKELKEVIREEFRMMLQKKDLQFDLHKKMVHDQQNQIVQDVKSHVINEQKRIKKQIKIASRKMRDLDGFKPAKKSFYQKMIDKDEAANQARITSKANNDDEIKPDEWIVSPEQAHYELMQIQKLLAKQRTMWKLKFETQRSKFEDEIVTLKTKLTSNQALWEQLQEADKRTKILQQELIFTQKSLSQCEKIIEKLKEELKLSETERIRLFQYKQNKAARLEELEYQVKKIDISEHINITKMIDMISTKDKELVSLKQTEKNFNERLGMIQQLEGNKKNEWQRKYEREVGMKEEAVKRLSQLKQEMSAAIGSDTPLQLDMVSQQNWKVKCKELLDICQGLANENADLLLRARDTTNASHVGGPTITINQQTLKSVDHLNKSRNSNFIGENQQDNLFASSNSLHQSNLPHLKQYGYTSMATPIQQQPYASSFSNNVSILSKRQDNSSPLHNGQLKTEYSELSYTDGGGNSSLANLAHLLPLKLIQPIVQQQLPINTNRQQQVQISKAYLIKNRQWQKRNVTAGGNSQNHSMYDNQHYQSSSGMIGGSTSTNASAYNHSSERQKQQSVRLQRDLSLPGRDRQNMSMQSEDFLLKGQRVQK